MCRDRTFVVRHIDQSHWACVNVHIYIYIYIYVWYIHTYIPTYIYIIVRFFWIFLLVTFETANNEGGDGDNHHCQIFFTFFIGDFWECVPTTRAGMAITIVRNTQPQIKGESCPEASGKKKRKNHRQKRKARHRRRVLVLPWNLWRIKNKKRGKEQHRQKRKAPNERSAVRGQKSHCTG